MKFSPKKIIFLAGIIGIFIFSPSITRAITIYPAIFEFNTAESSPLAGDFQIFNESGETIAIAAETENFTAKGEAGEQNFIPGNYGLAAWISLSEREIKLAPKEKKYVSFKINLPANAAPGAYSAGILWHEVNAEKEGIGVRNRVGALVLLSIVGDAKTQVKIAEFSVPQAFYEYPPVEFTVRVANEGNTLVKPAGEITIKNFFGKTVEALEINSLGNALLPQSVRRFNLVWQKEKSASFYKDLRLGLYSAELKIKYGGNETLKEKIKFWIIPWKILSLTLICILILCVGYFKIARHAKKKFNKA